MEAKFNKGSLVSIIDPTKIYVTMDKHGRIFPPANYNRLMRHSNYCEVVNYHIDGDKILYDINILDNNLYFLKDVPEDQLNMLEMWYTIDLINHEIVILKTEPSDLLKCVGLVYTSEKNAKDALELIDELVLNEVKISSFSIDHLNNLKHSN